VPVTRGACAAGSSIFASRHSSLALSSAGATRLHRSYDPVRLPLAAAVQAGVEAATLMPNGFPPITRITFPACRAHYPGGSNGCARRFLPRPCCLPRFAGGSASASLLSRPAQASLALRPIGSLNRPRRPSSRGSSPSGYPSRPLVSYRNNRQFSGWHLPPLVIRAFGAHCQKSRYLQHAKRAQNPWVLREASKGFVSRRETRSYALDQNELRNGSSLTLGLGRLV
jgi:hypothetical protein